jgi:hypothetical protein
MHEAGPPQGDRQRNIFFSNLEKEKDALMTPACFYMFMVPFSYLGQKDEAPKKAELTMLECCIRNTYFPDEFPNFVTNMNIIAETTKGPLPPFPSRAEAPDAQHTMG